MTHSIDRLFKVEIPSLKIILKDMTTFKSFIMLCFISKTQEIPGTVIYTSPLNIKHNGLSLKNGTSSSKI